MRNIYREQIPPRRVREASKPLRRTSSGIHRVYLVDCCAQEMGSTKYILSQAKSEFRVIGASTDPDKAVEEIIELKPDLVISGLRLDGINGITLLENLKKAGAETKFVILSHTWTTEAMRDLFRAGGSDYLLKGLETASMIKINTMLEHLCMEHDARDEI